MPVYAEIGKPDGGFSPASCWSSTAPIAGSEVAQPLLRLRRTAQLQRLPIARQLARANARHLIKFFFRTWPATHEPNKRLALRADVCRQRLQARLLAPPDLELVERVLRGGRVAYLEFGTASANAAFAPKTRQRHVLERS